MTTYVIASKPNAPALAECQILGEFLEQNCPDVTVKTVIKDSIEWAEFADATCRSYGFENKFCPIIYTIEGKLIGDGKAFQDHIIQRFNKAVPFNKDAVKVRNRQTQELNDELMRKKRDGDTISIKIENVLEKLKKKKVTNLITDAFYELKFEGGVPF